MLYHASVRIVSVSDMIPNLSRYIPWVACASLHPRPYRMLRVLMEILGGRGLRRHVDVSAVCKQPAHWEVGRENLSSILVEAKKEGKRRKSPVLTTVESTAVLFWNPLIEKWERPGASCRFWRYRPVDVAATPPGLSLAVGSPVE